MANFYKHYAWSQANTAEARAKKSRTFDDSTWTSINAAVQDINDELDKTAPDPKTLRRLMRRLENLHKPPENVSQDMFNQNEGTGTGQVFAGDKSMQRLNELSREIKAGHVKEPTSGQIIAALEELKESKRKMNTPYMPTGTELQQMLYAQKGVRYNAELGRWVKA